MEFAWPMYDAAAITQTMTEVLKLCLTKTGSVTEGAFEMQNILIVVKNGNCQ